MKVLLILLLVSFNASADYLYNQQMLQIQRQMLYEQQQYNRELQLQRNIEQSNNMLRGIKGMYVPPTQYEDRRRLMLQNEMMEQYMNQ